MGGDGSLHDVFPGASVMSAQMRAHDWAATPLGPPEHWPDGLKVPLRMMLTSRFEMWLGWGEDLAFFYNDAYVPTLGLKHPNALARPVAEVWREIYADVEGRFNSVMKDGVSTWDKALLLLLERSGYPEETYHTFSYSPLIGDRGAVGGLMCIVTEETERVIGERQMATLQALASGLLPTRSRAELADALAVALNDNGRDFPFHVLRFFDEAASVEATGDDPALLAADWPFEAIRRGARWVEVELAGRVADPPRGAWEIAPDRAVVVPITKTGQAEPAGALVLGLNPYRRDEAQAAGFAALVAAQISGALAGVDAHAAEVEQIEQLRQLFEQSPSFIAVLRGAEHRFELVNPGYLQLIGHRDVIGLTVREALPEIEGQGFFELLDGVYRTGEPFMGRSLPAVLQRTPEALAEPRFLDFVYQPIRNGDGIVTGIFVEGVDVTDAHDAAQALRKSEAEFRTLAEAMLNHVWTARPDGNLDWFNTRVYEYSGAAVGSLDGTGWAMIVHPDDIVGAAQRWEAALTTGAAYEAEFRLRGADGLYRWYIARAVAILGEDGGIDRWIGTNTDIDVQKSTTQALAELNATLEHQVQERTGALMAAEEALRQSQKMEAVGQLTGGIAHDFNNLLAGISGSLELLEIRVGQGRLDAIPRYLDAAQGAAKRASALTQRLLAFSRRQTLDPRPVNVNRLVGEMEDLIRRTVGPSVDMEVVGAGGIWLTMVDPGQLENALLNLCINARDAMPDGGRLTIETANKWLDDRAARERELTPGQYVSLCVTDTGTGMTPQVMAKAFDPFFTTKPLGQGTGLGLSMIYGFVRQSGGQVRIYSELDHGTTMCLYLPRYAGDAEAFEAAKTSASGGFDGNGETVLVVDDEPTVRMLIVDVLNEAGYQTVEADDGPAALRVLQSAAQIDLLITDVGLPGGMNGRQIADAGRVLRPALKVLFITGYAENAVVGNGHLDPGMQIVTKPFAVELLGEKVREMLDGGGSRG
jgi:PAS domain S-box-containing protein